MSGSGIVMVWVDSTSPLTVRETAGGPSLAARNTQPGWTPSVNDPVIAAFVKGKYRIIGPA